MERDSVRISFFRHHIVFAVLIVDGVFLRRRPGTYAHEIRLSGAHVRLATRNAPQRRLRGNLGVRAIRTSSTLLVSHHRHRVNLCRRHSLRLGFLSDDWPIRILNQGAAIRGRTLVHARSFRYLSCWHMESATAHTTIISRLPNHPQTRIKL